MKGPITIACYDNEFAANVALSHLRSFGIHAILNNALINTLWNLPDAAYTMISLLVNPKDITRARHILKIC